MSSEIITKQVIINEIQRIAKEHRETFSRSMFIKSSGISMRQINMQFGGWGKAVLEAGLNPNTSRVKKSHEELFQNLHKICVMLDKIPTTLEFERNSNNALRPYRKAFGTWKSTLSSFKVWLQENYPNAKFIDMIEDKDQDKPIIQPIQNKSASSGVVWDGKKDVVYGAPMDYKGLRYEPTNEQGVVFIFGKINEELGIIVEAVKTGFPDCEGKRLIDKNKNFWEPVSIEFEYKSKNFLYHGHDISKCDVIVCWIHDWQDCPIEVIELRNIIVSDSKY